MFFPGTVPVFTSKTTVNTGTEPVYSVSVLTFPVFRYRCFRYCVIPRALCYQPTNIELCVLALNGGDEGVRGGPPHRARDFEGHMFFF
ncbi:hypothetical protein HanRHA438_Chr06g0258511 [Helianthus annuus]|nr:hypothetical protein HanRHA438_Chr06g0258511 [Helianthus annuus]